MWKKGISLTTSIKYHYDGCKALMYYMGKLMREKEDLVYKLDRGWLGGVQHIQVLSLNYIFP